MQDKHRIQADLDWLINSPDFLSVASVNELHSGNLLNANQLLVNVVGESDSFRFEPTHRLGVYFEQLWHHLIRSNPSYELIRSNQQVIINKQTLGEFDSIIESHHAKETVHCELAVKFYLQIGSGEEMANWVGPNLRDRFDRKFKRLLSHQLALSSKVEVKAWLEQQQLVIDQSALLTRGRLFYAIQNFLNQTYTHPAEVATDHLKGFWATHEEFNSYREQNNFEWYQLPRMYWLSELTENDYPEVKKLGRLNQEQLATIVGMQNGKEVVRGFVVTDEWLQRARQRVLTLD
ncbi:DUF1853 family protein [Kangiella aquimarina]|uniref:DUF1853 family protein n=1 Tax=Kangiella aquimarina TaxID=261965 RepID=A0ABZ0X4B3_9GAMM|nr:DUF1853 family protein [Kangiella aquimarina]WQG85345.1 DUF1853 family protein [Kangiella aquimarina]